MRSQSAGDPGQCAKALCFYCYFYVVLLFLFVYFLSLCIILFDTFATPKTSCIFIPTAGCLFVSSMQKPAKKNLVHYYAPKT